MSDLKKMNTPVFWAEGMPKSLDFDNWNVEIDGLCENKTSLSLKKLKTLNSKKIYSRLTSVTRFSVGGNWGGISLIDLFDIIEPLPSALYVRFYSYGMVYDTSIPMEVAKKEKTMLAWEFNDEPLEIDYGGPVRIICPYLWGYKSAKSLVKIEFTPYQIPGFWEKRGYPNDALIEAGKMRDINDGGKIKMIKSGEVLGFEDE